VTLLPKQFEDDNKETSSKNVAIDVLDKIVSSIAPNLRRRLNQIVKNSREDDVVSLYRIYRLLEFYGSMTLEKKLLSETGSITLAITESADNAKRQFEEMLDVLADKLLGSPPSVSSNLSSPIDLLDVVDKMSKILKTHSTSPSQGLNQDTREKAFLPILTKFIQPLLRMCLLSAKASNCSSGETSIYMINCASTIQNALKSYDFVSHWVNKLVEEIGSWSDVLVREHADTMLRDCGLETKLRIMSSESGKRICDIEGLRSDELRASLKVFYSKVFSLTMPQFDRVQDSRLRSEARRSMCVILAGSHKVAFDSIMDSKSGYADPMSVVVHNPSRVRTLLDVD